MNYLFLIRDFLDYLVLFATILVGVIIIMMIYQRVSKKQNIWLLDLLKKQAVLFALIVSLTAVLGSLFFSEIIGYEPCKLCWFQRIFMYPLPLLFLIALIKKEMAILPYALTMSIIGGLIAIYHYFLQVATLYNVNVTQLAPCSAVGYSASCTSSFFLSFGYITIPMMSFIAFTLIILILLNARHSK